MYRIVIDPARGGTITSLVAKKEGGKEFADPQHRFAFGELRGFFYDQGQFHSSAQSPATVTVLCDNELEKSVRISGRIDTHPFTQTITLRKGERKIGFDLKIDWRHNVGIGAFRQKDGFNNNHRAFYDDRFNLNILFPVALDAPALYKDAPFDVCKSTLENTHFTNASGLYDPNHYSTATDIAMLMSAVMENDTCREILGTYQYTTCLLYTSDAADE